MTTGLGLLVLNPNTSVSVTRLLHGHIEAAAGPALRVRSSTARFGAPYIADEASYAVAAHATLDAWAAALADGTPAPHAVLIGCFGDPGLLALREASPVPVSGLAEAAFQAAAVHGRFAIGTGGSRWAPMLARLADALGHGRRLAGIETVAPSGAELAADPAAALDLLAQACDSAGRRFAADVVIVGGAGLAGMAAQLQPRVRVPLVDSVAAGARWAVQAVQAAPDGARRERAGFDLQLHGVSPALAALGRREGS